MQKTNSSQKNERFAIFDLDGTLLLGPSSEGRFFLQLLLNDILGLEHISYYVINFLKHRRLRNNKAFYRGLTESRIKKLAKEFVNKTLKKSISKEGLKTIEKERANGRKIMLLTGSPTFIVYPIASRIKADRAIGLHLEVKNGKFTGRYLAPYPFGTGKEYILVSDKNIDLSSSSGYGNHHTDIFFLCILGHPFCVNANKKLKKLCSQNNYKIIQWKK